MIMELYRKLDHAFNKDLVGATVDEVIEQCHKMGFKIETIDKKTTALYLWAIYHGDDTETTAVEGSLHLTFTPETNLLKRCSIRVTEY